MHLYLKVISKLCTIEVDNCFTHKGNKTVHYFLKKEKEYIYINMSKFAWFRDISIALEFYFWLLIFCVKVLAKRS